MLIKENLGLKENISILSASNALLRTTVSKLETHVATLKAEVSDLRSNFSALQTLDNQLSENSSTCGSKLESALTHALGMEVGLILLAVWLLCEHVGRPLWAKYKTEKFPIDRYVYLIYIYILIGSLLNPKTLHIL